MPGHDDSSKPGPKPERVKSDDDFDTLIRRALKKKPLRSVDGTEENQGDSDPESGDDEQD